MAIWTSSPLDSSTMVSAKRRMVGMLPVSQTKVAEVANMKSPTRTAALFPHLPLIVARPRRKAELSIVSSWTRVAMWSISTPVAISLALLPSLGWNLDESSVTAGLMRFPVVASTCSSISMMKGGWPYARERSVSLTSSRSSWTGE